MEILEKNAQGGNRPAPIKPATFLRGFPYHVSWLQRHRAISWYAFGVASLVEFQGCWVGLKFDAFLPLDAVLFEVSKQTKSPLLLVLSSQDEVKLEVVAFLLFEECC